MNYVEGVENNSELWLTVKLETMRLVTKWQRFSSDDSQTTFMGLVSSGSLILTIIFCQNKHMGLSVYV